MSPASDSATAAGSIHPTASISPDAAVDATVEVGPGTVIGPGVEIGRGVRIGAYVIVERDTGRISRVTREGTTRAEFVQQMDEAGFQVIHVDDSMQEDNIYVARPGCR